VTPAKGKEGKPSRPPEAVLDAALHLLGPRSRGVEELRIRLEKRGFKAGEVSKCLRWLQERRLLDDDAFSRAVVRDRVRFSPRGASVLRQELVRKGIDGETAAEAVEGVLREVGLTEVELAEAAARSWVRKQATAVQEALLADRFTEEREKVRRRLFGFLGRRGFRGQSASRGMAAGTDEAHGILSMNE
jgi:regulatory protein